MSERAHRIAERLSLALALVVLAAAAVVPGAAWSPGTSGLDTADVLTGARTLHTETGLAVAPSVAGEVMVSTGDGGGAGPIAGLDDAPVRVRAAAFRGAPCWEIGTEPGRPATYVDDNGVRLDDGMSDRLRVRLVPAPLALALLALLAAVLARRKEPRAPRMAAPALLAAAAFALALSI